MTLIDAVSYVLAGQTFVVVFALTFVVVALVTPEAES